MSLKPFFILILFTISPARADDSSSKTAADAALASARQQNSVLENRIRLLEQRTQNETAGISDILAKQNEMFEERMRFLTQQESLMKPLAANNTLDFTKGLHEAKNDVLIENSHKAYLALDGLAASVAKELECSGKNVVLYGSGHPEALLSVRAFQDQLGVLRSRLQSILDAEAPTAPDRAPQGAGPSVYSVAALAGPVQQSVLGLIAFFRSGGLGVPGDASSDEQGLTASIASAAVTAGCLVYWPDQYATNPYNPSSQIMGALNGLADLNDNGGAAGKVPGLQQRIRSLRIELRRSELMSEEFGQKIKKQEFLLAEATKRTEFLRGRIDWITDHIKDERNATIQTKLNSTFDKSWNDLESAVRKQLTLPPPQTIEKQNVAGEMLKNLDLLKTRTDWLAQYVKDEKDLILQDKVKKELASTWDELETAIRNLEDLTASVPRAEEPDEREQQRWDKYTSELKELIGTTTAASEAYTMFRGAALDGAAGSSPLSRMLRAEALRDLTFDDKLQERPGATIVQLKLQKLAGTYVTADDREDFSGGVVLSFVQYEPNGKVKKSGVRSAYAGFKSNK
jgi:hypothetical protein